MKVSHAAACKRIPGICMPSWVRVSTNCSISPPGLSRRTLFCSPAIFVFFRVLIFLCRRLLSRPEKKPGTTSSTPVTAVVRCPPPIGAVVKGVNITTWYCSTSSSFFLTRLSYGVGMANNTQVYGFVHVDGLEVRFTTPPLTEYGHRVDAIHYPPSPPVSEGVRGSRAHGKQ